MRELPSRKRAVVEALVYAALIRATTAMQALARFRRARRHVSINPRQWIKWWNRHLDRALDEVSIRRGLALEQLAGLLADPNVGRPPRREGLRLVGSTA